MAATHTRPKHPLSLGHGLGLALCAHIAAAYGGHVAFVPGRPVGARFRIELDAAG